MLEELLNDIVVVDFQSRYVCLGVFKRFDDEFLELGNADLHDLRDTRTSRENYVIESHATGVKRNRRRVFIKRSEMVAIGRLADVVDE